MTITSRFAGVCKSCGGAFDAGTQVSWARGKGAQHLVCPAQPVAPPARPTAQLAGAAAIAQFLTDANARGLKYPKARFMANGAEVALTRAGSRSKYPGSIQVLVSGVWVGRIAPDGAVFGPLVRDQKTLDALASIAADPAKAASAYGVLTGRCCFCMLELSDAGSVEVGYGPVCAKNYGLPHQPKGRPDAIAQQSQAVL